MKTITFLIAIYIFLISCNSNKQKQYTQTQSTVSNLKQSLYYLPDETRKDFFDAYLQEFIRKNDPSEIDPKIIQIQKDTPVLEYAPKIVGRKFIQTAYETNLCYSAGLYKVNLKGNQEKEYLGFITVSSVCGSQYDLSVWDSDKNNNEFIHCVSTINELDSMAFYQLAENKDLYGVEVHGAIGQTSWYAGAKKIYYWKLKNDILVNWKDSLLDKEMVEELDKHLKGDYKD